MRARAPEQQQRQGVNGIRRHVRHQRAALARRDQQSGVARQAECRTEKQPRRGCGGEQTEGSCRKGTAQLPWVCLTKRRKKSAASRRKLVGIQAVKKKIAGTSLPRSERRGGQRTGSQFPQTTSHTRSSGMDVPCHEPSARASCVRVPPHTHTTTTAVEPTAATTHAARSRRDADHRGEHVNVSQRARLGRRAPHLTPPHP